VPAVDDGLAEDELTTEDDDDDVLTRLEELDEELKLEELAVEDGVLTAVVVATEVVPTRLEELDRELEDDDFEEELLELLELLDVLIELE